MIRKLALAIGVFVLAVSVAGFFWVRSAFANDAVRNAIAAQLSAAIGQPVTIESISAGIYPRVTVHLGGVSIGQPARIQAGALRLGTNLRALFSRQIVGATVRLDDARLELPLPPMGSGSAAADSSRSAGWPVEVISIDEILLNDVQVVSGGRVLQGDIEAVPRGKALTLRRVSLAADDTRLQATGELTDISGPVGHLDITAETIDLTRLLTFLTDFSKSSGLAEAPGSGRGSRAPAGTSAVMPDVTFTLAADRVAMGALVAQKLAGKARATADRVVLDPVEFGLFGGRYQGSLAATVGDAPNLHWRAALSDVDVDAVMAFAGSPGIITGRLAAQLDLTSVGTDVASVVDRARGSARVDIRDGTVKNLGLVRAVVIATAMRADAQAASQAEPTESSDERFSRLGATLAVSNGLARTSDLLFESPDVTFRAAGSMRLDGSILDLKGDMQLSEALTQRAGRDLVRYTQQDGRVTVPATVTGSAHSPAVRVDVGALAARAAKNKIQEEAGKAIKKVLDGLFER
jgi:uncharacterized protein involved in outer membrane biogenesis